jgi:hypothetical protein
MASAGDATAKLDFVSQPNSKTGYMLFTHAGNWVVQLAADSSDQWTTSIVVVGSATAFLPSAGALAEGQV